MQITTIASPNWNERPEGTDINLVVLHYTGMKTAEEAIARLCDEKAEVSAHYMIDEGGSVLSLVPEEKRAWHAGVSSWRGDDNVNHNSIGIELVNPGHEFGYRDFPEAQIMSLMTLLSDIKKRWHIPEDGFVGHSDVAPGRKTDPGELFPWRALAIEGFGLFSDVDGSDVYPVFEKTFSEPEAFMVNRDLAIIGYDTNECDMLNSKTEVILRSFQMHWRPSCVSGVYDRGTRAVLQDICAKVKSIGDAI